MGRPLNRSVSDTCVRWPPFPLGAWSWRLGLAKNAMGPSPVLTMAFHGEGLHLETLLSGEQTFKIASAQKGDPRSIIRV